MGRLFARVRVMLILSMLLILPEGFAAAQTVSEGMSELAGEQIIVAKKKKRKKKKRKKKKRKKKKRKKKKRKKKKGEQTEEKKSKDFMGVKGFGGIATGVESDSTLVAFGGDVIMKSGSLLFSGGITSTSWSQVTETTAIGVSILTFGGGAGYLLEITDGMFLDITVQAGSTNMSFYTETLVLDNVVKNEGSESSLTITPIGGLLMDLDGMTIGAEVRKPIFLSDKFSDTSLFYILGTVGFVF